MARNVRFKSDIAGNHEITEIRKCESRKRMEGSTGLSFRFYFVSSSVQYSCDGNGHLDTVLWEDGAGILVYGSFQGSLGMFPDDDSEGLTREFHISQSQKLDREETQC
jgi:hypothetical protein